MAKEFSVKLYKSKAWQECRDSYIAKRVSIDGGLCERCGEYTGNLGYIMHHKIYVSPDNVNDPMVTLSHDNLEYLCVDCHNKEHFKEGHGQEKPRYIFGANGEVILIPDTDTDD